MKQDFDFMDELARKALENFEVPFNDNDWSLMEQQLDNGEDWLDKKARQELGNLEMPLNPQHWALFEQKLNQGEHLIDRVAEESLSNLQVPFNADHWALMEEKLDRREHRRSKLWLFKTIEVAVVGLAVLFFFVVNQKPIALPGSADEGQSDNSTTLQKTNEHGLSNHSQTGNSNESFEHLHTALAQQQTQGLNGTTQKAGQVQLRPTAPASLLAGKSFQQQTKKAYAGLNGSKNLGLLGISGGFVGNNHTNNKGIYTNGTNNSNQSLLPETPTTLESTPLLQSSETPTTPDLASEQRTLIAELKLPVITRGEGDGVEDPLFELKPIKASTNYKQRLRMGLLLGADANMDSGYGNSHLGYTGGWLLEAEFSYFVSLQTGLQVAQKNYRQQQSYDVTSPLGEQKTYTIEEESVTRLTHLQAPLQLQVAFFRNKHWRIGASAGAIFNFIVAQSHVGTQKLYQSGLTLYNDLNPNDFQRGWWQGASLRDNFYLTLGGGLLVERQLTDDWSLFVQPQYYHSITRQAARPGFKVGVFSMNVGVKKSF